MNFLTRQSRRLGWINLPGALLMMLLQRGPVVSVAVATEEIIIASPVGALLKAAVAVAAALGGVNTMVGATPLSPTSGTASGVTVTVGTPVSVFYTVTGTQTPPQSWKITGTIPGGLDFSGLTSAGTVNIQSLKLSGTPTTAGTFNVTIVAYEFASATGNVSPSYSYAITVNASGGGGPTNVAPSFTTQPSNQTVTVGGAVTFTATATGTPDPTYQWRKAGAAISGATNSSFSIASVATGDAGDYTVVATNSQGSATSSTATLTVSAVLAAPAFTTQPSAQTVTTGAKATFTATASGNPTPTYQWRKDGNAISGATSGTFSIAAVVSSDAGGYSVVATNSQGSATSNSAILTIGVASARNPVNATVSSGFSASFSAGNTAGAIQWQVSADNGTTWTNLAESSTYTGTNAATLVLHNATSALNNNRYRFTATANGVVATSTGATLAVVQVFFPFPTALVVDSSGNLFVTDSNTNTVQKVNAAAQVSLLAGASGTAGTTDGSGASARFNMPAGIALGAGGMLLVSDSANATVRKVDSAGAVTTLAGTANTRGSADGTGSAATFSSPNGLAIDANGNLFVADGMNDTLRKVTSTGAVTTLAGSAGVTGPTDGTGSSARFNLPTGLAIDGAGNLYAADTTNNTIRKITPAGEVSTLAGLAGVSGSQDGNGGGAFFNHPGGLAVDGSGNVYVADTGNSIIRKITSGGAVTTIGGLAGIAGLMDGTSTDSFFNQPQALTLDSAGNLFVADTGNAALRKITPAGQVTTLALSAAPATGGGGSTGGGSTGGGSTGGGSTGGGSTGGGSSGGGGGGGAPSEWFVGLLLLLASARVASRKS